MRALCILSTAALLAIASPAVSAELVTNGGFESGAAGWMYSGGVNFYCYGSTYRYQGNCAAYLGSQATAVIAPTAALSQSLATVSGATYNYSFALAHVQNFLASPDNTFSATIDGHQVSPQLTNSGAFSYAIYSGTFVASANATTIEFDVVDRGGNFNLDAVSVRDAPMPAAVPEPATWAMMIAGVGMIGGAMRRRSLQFAAG